MWQPIHTAPKDGEEILLYREDAGVFLGRWTAPIHFLTESELKALNLPVGVEEEEGWFFADIIQGDRCDEPPTHWMPLPLPPPFEPK